MPLNIRLNNQTVSLKGFTTASPEYSLCNAKLPYRKNGNTYYALASASKGTNTDLGVIGNLRYYANNSDPTLKCYKSGVFNFIKQITSNFIHIPKGVYSCFELTTRIEKYMSPNTSRQVGRLRFAQYDSSKSGSNVYGDVNLKDVLDTGSTGMLYYNVYNYDHTMKSLTKVNASSAPSHSFNDVVMLDFKYLASPYNLVRVRDDIIFDSVGFTFKSAGTYTKYLLARDLYGAIGEGNTRQLKTPCRVIINGTTKTAYYLKANYHTSSIGDWMVADLYQIKGYDASGSGEFYFILYDFADG